MNLEPEPGRVYLVGAGPGDPGLITWRGVQCLSIADAVLFDYLANPALLLHAPATAERICLGRHGRERIWTQEEINERLIALARQGKCVVRLKAGDPAVFARLSEELAALEAAGIAYEVVPGITAALAAASYAGIPLTERGRASAVAFVTGHEQDDKAASAIDFAALAAFPGTLVVYMGVTTARDWTQSLIDAGKRAETPAIMVRRCTWPDQQTIRCTLGTVAATIAEAHLRPPIDTIIGDLAADGETNSWFTKRPLFGQRVLVTRPRRQAAGLCDLLSELGAYCLLQPAIEIEPPQDWSDVDEAISRLSQFDWIVFSSANGVEFFLERLLEARRDLRALGSIRIAAIGSATDDLLQRYHLRADLIPDEFRAEFLAEALIEVASVDISPPRLLLVRASRGREVLAETLSAAGYQVEQVVAYSSRDVEAPDPEIGELLKQGRIDWVTVTSSAIARSLVRLFGDDLRGAKLASISPITSDTLRELGYEPAVEAREFTMEGVVKSILYASRK